MRGLIVALIICVLAQETTAAVRDSEYWRTLLKTINPRASRRIVNGIADSFPEFIVKYDLSNDLRISHFLGQCEHESAHFLVTLEYASGTRYNGRRDLGNVRPGDGPRYRGRGLIQLTGRTNYKKVGGILGQNYEGNPTLVEAFPHALEVSGVYWDTRFIITPENRRAQRGMNLNKLADADNHRLVTYNVNGGFNGRADRERKTKIIQRYLRENPGTNPAPRVSAIQIPPGTVLTQGNDQAGGRSDVQPSAQFDNVFISYIDDNDYAHYTTGVVDMRKSEFHLLPQPDPNRKLEYYINGQPVYADSPEVVEERRRVKREWEEANRDRLQFEEIVRQNPLRINGVALDPIVAGAPQNWKYQVGSFGNKANAERLVNNSEWLEMVQSGRLWIVRSKNSYPSKNNAELAAMSNGFPQAVPVNSA